MSSLPGYNGDPTSSPIQEVRFIIGDTNPAAPWLSDAEIAYLLAAANNDPIMAALRATEMLIARFSYELSETVGAVSIQAGTRVQNLRDLLALLRQRVSFTSSPIPYAGGIDAPPMFDPSTTRPFFDLRRNDGPDCSSDLLLGGRR